MSKYEPLPEHIKEQLRKWYGEPPTAGDFMAKFLAEKLMPRKPEAKSENRATQFVHKAQEDLAWLEHLLNSMVEEYEREFGVKVVDVKYSAASPVGRFKLIAQL